MLFGDALESDVSVLAAVAMEERRSLLLLISSEGMIGGWSPVIIITYLGIGYNNEATFVVQHLTQGGFFRLPKSKSKFRNWHRPPTPITLYRGQKTSNPPNSHSHKLFCVNSNIE